MHHHAHIIQQLFDLLASGILHHNPFAIAIVAFYVWLWLRMIRWVISGGPPRSAIRPPRYREFPTTTTTIVDRAPPPAPPAPRTALPGHDGNCPCLLCKAYRQNLAAARPALPAAPPPVTVMPAPSDDIAPLDSGCAHTHVVPVVSGGTLWRYTCANGQCPATWAPGAEFPPGTIITDPQWG